MVRDCLRLGALAAEFGAPDAVVTIAPICGGPYGLVATVRNLG